jgi:DsbC/DsbD-like thiol-disulfide interchange protein
MIKALAILASLSFSILVPGSPQAGQVPEEVLKAKLFVSRASVLPGEHLKIAVQATLAKPWHIHAEKVGDEFLIPTSLAVEPQEGLEVLETVYPKSRSGKFDYSETAIDVFEGDILVGALLKLAPGLPPGPRKLKVKFRYQACNDRGCLPPKTIELAAELEVVASGAAAEEDHSEVFKKIAFTKLK